MRELHAILTLAYRDLMKLLRDPGRVVATFILPFLFIFIIGGSMRGVVDEFGYTDFIFTGVLAQTLFQSAALGVVSLIDDREQDFSQEIFVSPISRYSIVFGKILGETLVSFVQGAGILLFGLVVGVRFSLLQLVAMTWVALLICLFGGAFGILVLSNLSSRRAAEQVWSFIILPQFFLAGVFNPITVLPWYLDVLSRISPMRYAVDLLRGVYYGGLPDYAEVVLDSPTFNLALMAAAFAVFMVVGTFLFVRNERNR